MNDHGSRRENALSAAPIKEKTSISNSAVDALIESCQNSIRAKQELLQKREQLEAFGNAVESIISSYRGGGRLYIAGNGGSAADAQHLAAELVTNSAFSRLPLPAEALTVDTSIITAISNDYGYEDVFARQLSVKARKGDTFLGITTSGNSENIIKALRQCRKMKVCSILFCGRDGGAAMALADFCVIAPGVSTATIQELHSVFLHTLYQCVEGAFLRDSASLAPHAGTLADTLNSTHER